MSAWRALGEHCKRSLHVGDPVVVHGRLSQRSYDRDGVEVTVLEIEALAVGHDLTRGVSSFIKAVGAARRDDRPQEQASTTVPAVVDPWAARGRRIGGRRGGGRGRVRPTSVAPGLRDRSGDPAPVPVTPGT